MSKGGSGHMVSASDLENLIKLTWSIQFLWHLLLHYGFLEMLKSGTQEFIDNYSVIKEIR